MNPARLYLLAAIAAISGGLARIAAAFPLGLEPVGAEALYTVIDILLLFGLIGIYLQRAERLGFLGVASFGVAVAALSFIGGPDADPFGFSTYEEGAAALAIAMVGLSIAWVRAGERPLIAPACWFGSVLAACVLMRIPGVADYALPIAGALFGGGFVAAGATMLKR